MKEKEQEQEQEGKTIFEHLGGALGVETAGKTSTFIPKIKKIALLFVMSYIGGVIADSLLGTNYLALVLPSIIAFTIALKLYKKFDREEQEAKKRSKEK